MPAAAIMTRRKKRIRGAPCLDLQRENFPVTIRPEVGGRVQYKQADNALHLMQTCLFARHGLVPPGIGRRLLCAYWAIPMRGAEQVLETGKRKGACGMLAINARISSAPWSTTLPRFWEAGKTESHAFPAAVRTGIPGVCFHFAKGQSRPRNPYDIAFISNNDKPMSLYLFLMVFDPIASSSCCCLRLAMSATGTSCDSQASPKKRSGKERVRAAQARA